MNSLLSTLSYSLSKFLSKFLTKFQLPLSKNKILANILSNLTLAEINYPRLNNFNCEENRG